MAEPFAVPTFTGFQPFSRPMGDAAGNAMGKLYTNAKVLWFPERLEALRSGEPAAPVHVRIKPTNVCNHDCYFCAYRRDGLTLGQDMNRLDRIPRDKMLEIVDDLVEMGVEAVTFSGGGEPLIYPHIVDTVERLARGGVKVAALSNGSRLMGRVAEAFAEHATWIRVSIDGWDGDSYSRYRNVKAGEFERVIENLRAFAQRRSRCALGASVIADRGNSDKILALARLLKECGVSTVKISPCIVSNSGGENNAHHAPVAEVVREQIAKARDELSGSRFEIVDHYHALAESFERPYRSCPFLHYLTVIGADCRVYTCQDKAYTDTGVLGSIRHQRFKDFWFSDENRRAMGGIQPRIHCRHHCVAEAKNRLLFDYLEVDPSHAAFV